MSFTLWPLLLILLLSITLYEYLYALMRSSLTFLRTKQAQLLRLLLIRHILHTLHLCCPLLDSLQWLLVLSPLIKETSYLCKISACYFLVQIPVCTQGGSRFPFPLCNSVVWSFQPRLPLPIASHVHRWLGNGSATRTLGPAPHTQA